jgi:murein DD-endopeptidase MepM/ murein hydrolase activator NlpD
VRRRALGLVAVGALSVMLLSEASAAPLVQHQLHQRQGVVRDLDALRVARDQRAHALMREIAQLRVRLDTLPPRRMLGARWSPAVHHLDAAVFHLRVRLMRLRRFENRLIGRLADRRDDISIWLGTWATFKRCPVDGPNTVADNFGVMVRLPGVPVHVHQGNDIGAATGTPILAPFDGMATASSSELGGLEVRVQGSRGYVYNAHLASYGQLGSVRMGAVIGYVGSTGDATAPHDHFEWHPGNGGAVDPHALLAVVC